MTIDTFDKLTISEDLLKALEEMNFSTPTAIQAEVIPLMLANRDVLAIAPTGTGKTCAFAIPIAENIDLENNKVQALIMCPTRELAMQTTEEFRKVLQFKEGVKCVAVYGGQNIDRQLAVLKRRPQIVIGTPGRLMDHLRRKTLKLDGLTTLVLDEADEMLNMGFRDDIDTVIKAAPSNRRTVLFSATMPKEIAKISENYQTNPAVVKVALNPEDMPKIEQIGIRVDNRNKDEKLVALLQEKNFKLGLIFCNTKSRVDKVMKLLDKSGYACDALHSDIRQNVRTKIMKKFRNKEIEFLVATDVAARGIDVDDIEVIINYDIPNDKEFYTHRIGRTGRANKSGVAYSLYYKDELIDLFAFAMHTKGDIELEDGDYEKASVKVNKGQRGSATMRGERIKEDRANNNKDERNARSNSDRFSERNNTEKRFDRPSTDRNDSRTSERRDNFNRTERSDRPVRKEFTQSDNFGRDTKYNNSDSKDFNSVSTDYSADNAKTETKPKEHFNNDRKFEEPMRERRDNQPRQSYNNDKVGNEGDASAPKAAASTSRSQKFAINIGKFDEIRRVDIRKIITENTPIPKDSILDIHMQDKVTFIELSNSFVDDINLLNGIEIADRKIRVEQMRANKPSAGSASNSSRPSYGNRSNGERSYGSRSGSGERSFGNRTSDNRNGGERSPSRSTSGGGERSFGGSNGGGRSYSNNNGERSFGGARSSSDNRSSAGGERGSSDVNSSESRPSGERSFGNRSSSSDNRNSSERSYGSRSGSGERSFGNRSSSDNRNSGERSYGSRSGSGERSFGGSNGGGRSYSNNNGERSFGGARSSSDVNSSESRPSGERSFGNRSSSDNRNSGERSYGSRSGSGERSFGNRSSSSDNRNSGERSYGSRSNTGERSFGGARSSSSDNRSSAGGERSSGGVNNSESRPSGERSYGSRSGERSFGDRTNENRNRGERSPSRSTSGGGERSFGGSNGGGRSYSNGGGNRSNTGSRNNGDRNGSRGGNR